MGQEQVQTSIVQADKKPKPRIPVTHANAKKALLDSNTEQDFSKPDMSQWASFKPTVEGVGQEMTQDEYEIQIDASDIQFEQPPQNEVVHNVPDIYKTRDTPLSYFMQFLSQLPPPNAFDGRKINRPCL
jgi:hypothetical protein